MRRFHRSLTPMIHSSLYKLSFVSSLLIKYFCSFLDSYQREHKEETVYKILSIQQNFLLSLSYHLYSEKF